MVSQNTFFSTKARTQRHGFLDSNSSQDRGHLANTLDEISQDSDEDEPPGGIEYSLQLDLEDDSKETSKSRENDFELIDYITPPDYLNLDDALSEIRTYVYESQRISIL